MRKLKILLSILSVVALAGTLLAGCSGSGSSKPSSASPGATAPADKPVDGGTLTFSSFSDIVTVNPIYIQDTASGDAQELAFAFLYNLDRKGNVAAEPWSLAAELPKVSDDGKTYTVKLKSGAKWSDGQPVTADDIVYTFNTIRNPDAGAPAITQFDKIDTITKTDEKTVQIQLKQVYSPFLYSLNVPLAPYHVLKDVDVKELQKHPFGKDPAKTVTSGPWKWTEWTQKEHLTFEADPNYWGQQKPHIQKIIYKIYADQNTEVQALIKGDVDLTAQVPVAQLDAVKKQSDLNVILEPGPQYEYLGFNFDAKNFSDNFTPFTGIKTRQALAFALNRQGLVDSVLKGTGKLINAPFLPGSWSDPGDAAVNYKYDPEKAKSLLKEDGWAAGSDGILQKDGHRFSFELQYNSGNSRRQQVAAVIQQNLKDVGIEVNPKAIDFSSWIDQNVHPGKYQAILLSWSLTNPDPGDNENIFSSKYFPPAGQNTGWYKNGKLDDLWVKATSTVKQEERKKIYAEVGKEISTDLPYVFLYQYGTPFGINKKVHYAEADKPEPSLAYGYFFHIINWWIDTK